MPGAATGTQLHNRVDGWRSVAYAEADGSFHLTGAALVASGQPVTVAAPHEEIPLLVQAGSVVAMLPPDVQALAAHGSDPAIVHLADRAGKLHVLAFPHGQTTSRFYAGESLDSAEGIREWRLTVAGTREYTIDLEAALGVLATPFVPCERRRQRWHARQLELRRRWSNCRIQPACGLRAALKEALAAFMRTLDGYTLADLVVHRREPLARLFKAS